MVAEITLTISWGSIAAFTGFFALILAAINLLIKVNKNHKDLMKTKVDQIVYEEHIKGYEKHCTENKQSFERMQQYQICQLDKQNQLLRELFDQSSELKVQVAETRKDIGWMKDLLSKKIKTGGE